MDLTPPPPPAGLSKELQAIWNKYVPRLEDSPKARVKKYIKGVEEIVAESFKRSGPDPQVESTLRIFQKIAESNKVSWVEKDQFFGNMDLDRVWNETTPELEAMMNLIDQRSDKPRERNRPELLWNIRNWLLNEPIRLEKNEHSRFHKMCEYLDLVEFNNEETQKKLGLGVFVVKHDWASAFPDLEEGDIQYPFGVSIFEFRITGKTVIAIVWDIEKGMEMQIFIEHEDKWGGFALTTLETKVPEFLKFVKAQIRAICVMLETQVAEHTLIRQPEALQRKRIKQNKLPLYDYHVIDLARKHKAARNPNPTPTGRRVRCHFRRGHWRHYEAHKVWISWMLVGDPDLGFVESDYKL